MVLYELIFVGGSGRGFVIIIDFCYKEFISLISIFLQLEIFDCEVFFIMVFENMCFVMVVVGFVFILGELEYKGILNYDYLVQWVINVNSYDFYNYCWEFIDLVDKVKDLR